jgi:hypothetical protein
MKYEKYAPVPSWLDLSADTIWAGEGVMRN